jgi:hypothetical protein
MKKQFLPLFFTMAFSPSKAVVIRFTKKHSLPKCLSFVLAAFIIVAALSCRRIVVDTSESDIRTSQHRIGPDATTTTSSLRIVPSNAVKVARVTGATRAGETLNNPNQTHTRWKVNGTDLGIIWDAGGGKVMIAYGDTYGAGWVGPGAPGGGTDWRKNVLGISTDTNPNDGLTMSSMIEDVPGHAKQIIASESGEVTVIPTAGVSVGTRHYIQYMSVKQWQTGTTWVTNHGGIAYSDNGGQTWTRGTTPRWANNATTGENKFQQGAFARAAGWVWLFGTPNGRTGGVYLAQVPEGSVLNKSAYQYWNGSTWVTNNPAAAVQIVPGPVGEMSVAWNSYYKLWIMAYLDVTNANVPNLVVRTSPAITGPWSEKEVLATGSQYGGLYGSFMHPWFQNGPDIYFTMSQWDPYNVFWMKATLSNVAGTIREAESAVMFGGAAVYSDPAASGLKGVGYISQNGGLYWEKAPAASSITIRHAVNGTGQLSLYINNVYQQKVSFPNTGAWSGTNAYKTVTVNKAIPSGAMVTFRHDGGTDYAVNFDYIKFN